MRRSLGVAVVGEPVGLIEQSVEGPASLQSAFDGRHECGPPRAVLHVAGCLTEAVGKPRQPLGGEVVIGVDGFSDSGGEVAG